MKKIKNIIKNNYKLLIGIIIGGILFGSIGVYAATIAASSVSYTSNGQSTVNGALDDLYTRASKWVNPNDMGTPTNYIFDGGNKPTTSSPTTPPSGKNIYLGLYADNQYGVCINRNGTQHCFRYNNWIAELKHIQEVFSESNDSCRVTSSFVSCDASDFGCGVSSDGYVNCHDNGARENCSVYGDGSVSCS